MARPYRLEMARLAETLDWALGADLGALQSAVREARSMPLVAIGSGGSLSAAHALAYHHRASACQVASVLMPLEASTTSLDPAVAVWLLSASGNDVDIVAAARNIVLREPRQLTALVGDDGSKLEDLAELHPYMEHLVYRPPASKDGLLATNSLFAFCTIIARAYSALESDPAGWTSAGLDGLRNAVESTSPLVRGWHDSSRRLWDRETTVVLHGANGTLGAIDLESKFTEAALGHAQIADFRNFAHGRHRWLAKRRGDAAVLALISEDDAEVAERTLDLLPSDVPVAHIGLPGAPGQAALVSLLAAFRLTEWAGQARGIDPGDPGEPEIARRLSNLKPSVMAPKSADGLTRREVSAIQRKSGRTVEHLTQKGELKSWKRALDMFRDDLVQQSLDAIVLDYDGTIVDTRHGREPPAPAVSDELIRLLEAGLCIGIATGRGNTVRPALEAVIPPALRTRVVIGYYNGSQVATLADDSVPSADRTPSPELEHANRLFDEHPELNTHTQRDIGRDQLTLSSDGTLTCERLWQITNCLVKTLSPDLAVLRSSHSVDVVTPAASKINVITWLRTSGVSGTILVIGDRGLWPGNDYELLSVRPALSVDECGPAPETCWNLGQPGHRGPAITLEYLKGIRTDAAGARFDPKELR
jgi:hydroxymethylpyrimidine pyrophosphatase-like HAD family hydrolase/fructoselysine-6-P-deglycase FrlB-like protein